MDLRDTIESKCWGRTCLLLSFIGFPGCFCIPTCFSDNCCTSIGYDQYCQSIDGKVLRDACNNNDINIVKNICDKWKDSDSRSCCLINPITEGGDNIRLSAIHICALNGNAEILQLILETKRVNIDQYIYYEYPISNIPRLNSGYYHKFMNTTAIHLAVRNGHIECLKLLIKYGANLKKPVYEFNNITTNTTEIITTISSPTEFSTIQDLSKQFINDMTIKYDTRTNFLFNVASSSSSVKNPSQENTTTTTTNNPLTTTNKPTTSVMINNPLSNRSNSNSKIRSVDYGACLKVLESHGFEFDYDYAINQAYQYNNYELLETLLKGGSSNDSSSSNSSSGDNGSSSRGDNKKVGMKDSRVNTMYLLHRGIKDRKKIVFFKLLLRCGVDVNYIDNNGKVAACYASK